MMVSCAPWLQVRRALLPTPAESAAPVSAFAKTEITNFRSAAKMKILAKPRIPVGSRTQQEAGPAAQTVQPWWFGEPAFKATGLYLRRLPILVPTDKLTPPKRGTDEHEAWSKVHRLPPSKDRWRKRSETFPGIASAMASQWGGLLPEESGLFAKVA
jgi:hypothetical protein